MAAFNSNGTDPGPTGHCSGDTNHVDECYEFCNYVSADYDCGDRNMYIAECRLRLFSALGAFVLNGQLVYWRVSKGKVYRPVLNRRPVVIMAGYMPEARGLHWDRKRH